MRGTVGGDEGRMRGGRAALINLSLMAVTFGLGLILAEGAFRVLAPQKTMYPRWIDSPEYPLALPPNTTVVSSQGSLWRFEYHTNRLGLRGDYISPRASEGTISVVSLGDSFTFGAGVNDEEVYTQELARLLGPGYSVINAGMGGWGIDAEIKWFFKEGVAYAPRVVTLQFTRNDLGDSYGVTRLDGSELTFHPNPNVRPAWQLLISRSALIQKSHLWAAFRAAIVRLREGRAPEPPPDSPREAARPAPAEQDYTSLLRAFAVSLRKRGSSLLFVSVTHGHPDGTYHFDVDHFPTIKAELDRLQTEGLLRFVELPTAELSRYPGSPEGHQWAAVHHRLVARALAREIDRIGSEAEAVDGDARANGATRDGWPRSTESPSGSAR